MEEQKTYKAALIKEPNGKLSIEELQVPTPSKGDVLVRVEACGLCHSDFFTQKGVFPGVSYPRVPGHEVVGTVAKAGPDAKRFKVGDRVGRGWHGTHCFECRNCLHGNNVGCDLHCVTGIHVDGGYAEYMLAPWQSLALVPDELSSVKAAPLMCAGLTVYNAMRNQNVLPGSLVAVQGIGGLGHLAIQFAVKMGYKVAAVSSSGSKKDLAKKLGAHVYIDTSSQDPAKELQDLGGADMAVATAYDSDAISRLVDGLGFNGKLIVLGAAQKSLNVTPFQLIGGKKAIIGWASGVPIDAEATMKFAALTGVDTMVETFPLDKAQEAFDYMMSGKARFRVVISMDTKST